MYIEPEFLRFAELLPDAILLLSTQGRIEAANREISEQLAVAPGGLVGRDLTSLARDPSENVAEQLRLWTRSARLIPGALTLTSEAAGPLRYRCDGGLLRPAHDDLAGVVVLRLTPKDRSVAQFVALNERIEALGREVEARYRLEAENSTLLTAERAARLEAEHANRAKDEFLAVVSHELRTPLTPILSWARILRMHELDPATTTKGLETIERAARSQAQIVEDLLDVSRITAGKMRLDVRSIDLATVVAAAVDAIRPAADAKNIRLSAVLDPRPGIVAGDSERLQQVVWNLVSNAVKFTPKGGSVEVLLHCVSSHVEIVVTDNGRGIRPEFLPFVFDRFRQQEGTPSNRPFGGLGLGLAIVRHLVEMHGGTVTAESLGVDRGASFTVRLPLSLIQPRPRGDGVHPRVASDGAPVQPLPSLAGTKILAVDDEPDTLDTICMILTGAGAEVRAAVSTAAALRLLDQWPPDILVSDIGMPSGDGYALIHQVRALPHGAHLPALALTALARVEDRLRILSAGFQMHVAKPIEPAELIISVASLCSWRGRPPMT